MKSVQGHCVVTLFWKVRGTYPTGHICLALPFRGAVFWLGATLTRVQQDVFGSGGIPSPPVSLMLRLPPPGSRTLGWQVLIASTCISVTSVQPCSHFCRAQGTSISGEANTIFKSYDYLHNGPYT